MLNISSNSKNETFLIIQICEFAETWVVTQRDTEGHHPQNDAVIASSSIASTAHVAPMVELSKSTGWDFESTIKFYASTGEEYCEWFVCGSVVPKSPAFDIKQAKAGWLHSFLSFLPETRKLQSASEWK